MGSVSNIPLKPDNKFFLLFLSPPNRSAIFHYDIPSDTRARGVVEVNEEGAVVYHEIQEFMAGGAQACATIKPDDDDGLSEASRAKLSRLVQQQYISWDNMRILDRINLQITWATDAIKRTEEDLMYVIANPRDDIRDGCWDTVALLYLVDAIEKWYNQREGLVIASETL